MYANNDITPIIETSDNILSPLMDSTELYESIMQSKDKIFFISYTPTGTMLRQWFPETLFLMRFEEDIISKLKVPNRI